MIMNWAVEKVQWFLPAQEVGLDELNFDFALSAEVMDLLCANNGADQQDEAANEASKMRVALDEYELALA
jgi:hypothetical protein